MINNNIQKECYTTNEKLIYNYGLIDFLPRKFIELFFGWGTQQKKLRY